MKQKKRVKRKIKKMVVGLIFIGFFLFFLHNYFYFTLDNPIKIEEIFTKTEDTFPEKLTYDNVSSVKNNEGTMEDRLKKLSLKEDKINTILDNKSEYPEELLDALSRNIDMLDFVLNYPKKKGNSYSDTIGEIDSNIPLLLQWDERWGYINYGDNILAINGCGPTALAMVISWLKKDSKITPSKVALYAYEKGYYVDGVGTSWSLMSKGASFFDIKSEELPLDKNIILNTLKKGHPIICAMGKGDFTLLGHFIVLVGIEDGRIQIHDPNSETRSSLLWEYERIAPQIKNLWAFSKIE